MRTTKATNKHTSREAVPAVDPWAACLSGREHLSLGPDQVPYLFNFLSCFLAPAEGENPLKASFTDWLNLSGANLVKHLKGDLQLIFPDARRNVAGFHEPLYEQGILANLLKFAGMEGGQSTTQLFQSIFYIANYLYHSLPGYCFRELDPQKFNRGLRSLSLYLGALPSLFLTTTKERAIEKAFEAVHPTNPAPWVSKPVHTAPMVLYDLRSLFYVVKEDENTPGSMVCRWLCTEASLANYVERQGITLDKPAPVFMRELWNAVREHCGQSDSTILANCPVLSGDMYEQDKSLLISALNNAFDVVKERSAI